MATTLVDLKLVYTTDPASGQLTVDFAQASNGDLATVSGIDLLVQTITRWMLLRVGSFPFRPTFGNPVLDLAGQAASADPAGEIGGLVQMAQATYLQMQAQAVTLGYLSPDEQAASFSTPQVSAGSRPGQYQVSFMVTSAAGQTGTVSVPLSA